VVNDQRVTAREWFASGLRRPYDPIAKTMVETPAGERSAPAPHAFEKVVGAPPVDRALRIPALQLTVESTSLGDQARRRWLLLRRR
jgi:hypothetical protein